MNDQESSIGTWAVVGVLGAAVLGMGIALTMQSQRGREAAERAILAVQTQREFWRKRKDYKRQIRASLERKRLQAQIQNTESHAAALRQRLVAA